jgi:hypothetical protein
MATNGTPLTYTFDPDPTIEIIHNEGEETTLVFTVKPSGGSNGAAGGTTSAPPAITQIDLSPILQVVATKSIETVLGDTGAVISSTGTVIIGTSSLYPWKLSFKLLGDNSVFTEDNSWYSPPNSAVFNYDKKSDPPILLIDVYADIPDPDATTFTQEHKQYTVKAIPNYSAGRDELVKLALASPV